MITFEEAIADEGMGVVTPEKSADVNAIATRATDGRFRKFICSDLNIFKVKSKYPHYCFLFQII
jgi:hypothetical protein